MKISYAQRLEDHHLDLALGDVSGGFYIDIGGGHPVADNVSYHFYLKGWHGLIIEPQAALAELYAHLRPRDIVLSHLVGAQDGVTNFHQVDRLHGFSTIVEDHAKGASAFGADYKTIPMPIRRLDSIIKERGITRIDFLKIDVEGAEADVLAGMDWQGVRPRVICIEAVAPGSMAQAWQAWEPVILDAGYHFAYWDELNRFYVAKEHAELLNRFPKGPSPWDCVTHFYEFGRVHQNSNHPDHALATRLIKGFLASLPELREEALLALLARSAGKNGMESGTALAELFYGKADYPGREHPSHEPDFTLDDRARAALGRIAAQYDGGMVHDE